MKKNLLFLLFITICLVGHTQAPTDLQPVKDLELFNSKRLQINRTGMITLGAWAVGNFLAGGIGWSRHDGSKMYFHQGNVMWNTVNLALAGFGLYGAMHAEPASFDLFQTITEQYSMEKLLLFNAGLDIGYIATGFFLMERGRHVSKHSDRFKGYGQALILQGGFLFLFDIILFAVHNHHGRALQGLVPVINATGEGIQMGLSLTF